MKLSEVENDSQIIWRYYLKNLSEEIIQRSYPKKLSANSDVKSTEEEDDSSKLFWFATHLKFVLFLITIGQKTVTTLNDGNVSAPEMTNQAALVITAIRLLLNSHYSHEAISHFSLISNNHNARLGLVRCPQKHSWIFLESSKCRSKSWTRCPG